MYIHIYNHIYTRNPTYRSSLHNMIIHCGLQAEFCSFLFLNSDTSDTIAVSSALWLHFNWWIEIDISELNLRLNDLNVYQPDRPWFSHNAIHLINISSTQFWPPQPISAANRSVTPSSCRRMRLSQTFLV